jgi:hypothetical protein
MKRGIRRGLALAAVGAATAVLAGTAHAATATFGAPVDVPVGSEPSDIAAVDLDGDGHLDLVTVNQNASSFPSPPGSISLLFGDGRGGFTRTDLAAGTIPSTLAVGDVNGDGRPDIAAANNGDATITVYVNQGGRTFTPHDVSVGADVWGFALGDVTGDGRPDLVVGYLGFSHKQIEVFPNDGSGDFSASTGYAVPTVGVSPHSVAVGDLNGDGRNDIVVAHDSRDGLGVLLNQGGGTFSAETLYGSKIASSSFYRNVNSNVDNPVVADLNGDGRPDVLAALIAGGAEGVWTNLGGGALSANAATYPALQEGSGPLEPRLGDFNLDGNLDLVDSLNQVNQGFVLYGTGTGAFGNGMSLDTSRIAPVADAVGDFNEDGKADVAFALYQGGNKVRVYLNTTPDTTPPVLSGVPGDQTASTTSAAGTTVSWSAPTATDIVDGAVPVTCAPASGSRFAPGTTRVTCSATDRAGNTASASFDVTVTLTEQPIVASPVAIAATEGAPFTGTVATFTDPDPAGTAAEYAATVDWGDGSPVQAATIVAQGGGFAVVAGPHAYAEEGTYDVTVAIADVDNADNGKTVTSKATVADAPLTVTSSGSLTGAEGSPLSGILASFTDANPAGGVADYSATVDWGDGHTTPGVVAAAASGGFTVSGTHTYAEEGHYTIGVHVADTGGAAADAAASAAVADAALTASGSSLTSPSAFTGAVATFTDANPAATVGDFTARIDWGDGHTSAGTVSAAGGRFVVSGSHAFASTGPFDANVTILDEGGATAAATTHLLVYATTAGGSFVIGDRSAGNGAAVTFWGAQWAKRNAFSGGGAPASFKGFAADATGSCGTGWTSAPGDSARPPATVPAYVAVVVASSVSKHGSAISGDTVKVVVVKTNAGYGPTPGDAGTGTVVATVCG